ncbi:MAG: hypothetical protein WBD47_19655 [Phormidesmis sp.]
MADAAFLKLGFNPEGVNPNGVNPEMREVCVVGGRSPFLANFFLANFKNVKASAQAESRPTCC